MDEEDMKIDKKDRNIETEKQDMNIDKKVHRDVQEVPEY
jgi:hypothetical protein